MCDLDQVSPDFACNLESLLQACLLVLRQGGESGVVEGNLDGSRIRGQSLKISHATVVVVLSEIDLKIDLSLLLIVNSVMAVGVSK